MAARKKGSIVDQVVNIPFLSTARSAACSLRARSAKASLSSFFLSCSLGIFLILSQQATAATATGGQIRGRVSGPDGKPVPGAAVVLTNNITGYRQQVTTNGDGGYLLYNVPENPYHLEASLPGVGSFHGDVDVRGGAPVVRDLALTLEVSASTSVSAEKEPVALEGDTSMTHIDIDKSLIRRTAAAVPGRAFESIVTSTPGFSADENGRYHFQGGHSQQLLVIDGQPIGDQIGVTFSNSLDPGVAESIEIVTGGIPAEYGEKANGVINLTTRSGLGYGGVKGDVGGGAARFSTYSGSAALGGGNSRFGWFANVDGSSSDRFLDPVSFDNFHNHGESTRAFLRLDTISESGSDNLRLTGNIGRTKRDVTNLPSQEDAGQDQHIQSNDWNANLGYQKVFGGGGWVLEAQAYARDSRLTLYSSVNDTPVQADQNRSLANQGINLALTRTAGINDFKVGVQAKRFPIQEQFSFGITDPGFNDPASDGYNPNLAPYDLTRGGSVFRFSDSKTGTYVAAYLQDNIRWKDLTINVGLRFDHNNLFESENQLQPRVGIAYYLKSTGTVFRASYNRMFITPEYENILLSSSSQAAAITPPDIQANQQLGEGHLFNVSERHDVYNVGVQQGIGSKVRLDLSYWYRKVRNAADQDQFFNTGIVFPLNFDSGKLQGWNVRLDLAPVLGGLRGYVSLGHVKAQYCNPFVGGLFLDSGALDTLAGGCFLIDHDQDIQEQAGFFYDFGQTGFWAGVTQRFDSGLVTDAGTLADVLSSPDTAYAAPYIHFDQDPQRVSSRTLWSFSLGARLQKYGIPIELQADLLNAFDVKGLYNFQSVFGGTHVVPPRTWAARMKFVF